jgi:hypothetical protein
MKCLGGVVVRYFHLTITLVNFLEANVGPTEYEAEL